MGTFLRLLDEGAGSMIIGIFLIAASMLWFMVGLIIGSSAEKAGVSSPPKWLKDVFLFSWITPPIFAFGAGIVYVFARPVFIVMVHFLPFLGEELVIANGERVPASGQYSGASAIFARMQAFYASMGLGPFVAAIGAWLSWGAALIGNVAAYYGLYKWMKNPDGLKSILRTTFVGPPRGDDAPKDEE